MKNFSTKLINRQEIAELKDEQKSLELRLPSMREKLRQSQSTAQMWEEQSKKAYGTEREKQASVAYYWKEVEKDKKEVNQMEDRLEEINKSLSELGCD